jgi:hypothetical protein
MAFEVKIMTCPGCGSRKLTAYYRCTKCGGGAFGAPTEWSTSPVPEDPQTFGVPARQQCPGCGALTNAHAITCGDCDWAQTY